MSGEIEQTRAERRADRRRRLAERSDAPVARRMVGFLILAATLYYGLYGTRSIERPPSEPFDAKAKATPALQLPKTFTAPQAVARPAPLSEQNLVSPLSAEARATVFDCTKGVQSMRLIDVKAATLDELIKPALGPSRDIKHRLELQNIRIRRPDAEEWRLHASAEGAAGQLGLKLFRVASDGLPESIPFPDALASLRGSRWSTAAVDLFKKQGELIEEEDHETYSFRDKTGVQLIRIDGKILELLMFLPGGFLACSRDRARGITLCQCKPT